MSIEIYTKGYCPFCHRAKRVLDDHGLSYEEYDVTFDRSGQHEMLQRTGGRTVPQIIIDGVPIGGSDELVELARSGELQVVAG